MLIFGNKGALVDALRSSNRQNGGQLTDAQIDQAVNVGMVVAVVIALLCLLFAFKLRAGRNRARIVLTVITALQLISLLVGQCTVLGYIGVLARGRRRCALLHHSVQQVHQRRENPSMNIGVPAGTLDWS
ncbi:hypothetical protein AB0878_18585 [Amycolatopsis sp. NPDC047767]|uniref:hypothetical protein n=1 Tax=Amycolatopsis sp. NPDC047767 TaxID=3156765 RepID=UPI0034514D2D